MARTLAVIFLGACSLPLLADEPKPQAKKPPYERLLKGDDANQAAELEQRIDAAEKADRFDEAIRLAQELLALRTRVQGADHWETVDQRWLLDRVRKVAALPPNQRAGWHKALANEPARSEAAKGKPADLEVRRREVLRWHQRVLGERHPDTAASYTHLAANLYAQGKYADAQPLLQMALDLRRALLGEKHPATANSYNNLAGNLDDQGKYADAQPLHQKALDVRRELLGEQHPDTVTSYLKQAYSLCGQAKHGAAESLLVQARTSYEAARLKVAAKGLERAAFGAAHSPYRPLAALQARRAAGTAAWLAAETDLGRGLSDEAAFRRGTALTPGEQAQQAALSRQLDKLQQRVLSLIAKEQLTLPQQQELSNLQAERRTLEARLAELAVTLSQREIATLHEVQSALAADAALVLWIDVTDRFGGVQAHWGCILRQGGEPKWERLPGSGRAQRWTAADEALPDRLRTALASDSASAEQVAALARQLHVQRLAPMAQHLGGVKRLYVVPVGRTARIPVEMLTTGYTISYVPSGTFLARLKDKGPAADNSLLALGDPVFQRVRSSGAVRGINATPLASDTALPPAGLLILEVAPQSAAARAGLRPRDVLVAYAGVQIHSVEQLSRASQTQANAREVPITVWREGVAQPFARTVPSGRLGIVLNKEPARQAIANRRKADAVLLALRGGHWQDLPGTRIEVALIARLFGPKATMLLDSAASEQTLDEQRKRGELSKYRYLHFATHGETNDVRAFDSALILAQDRLPETPLPRAGEPFLNGQLSAAEVREYWNLNAELVTLSACETALGQPGGGDGLLGFAQAFLLAGSRAVCLSLWKVDDTATALLMTRFYQNLLGQRPGLERPLGKAAALDEAKRWLRDLTGEHVLALTATMSDAVVRGNRGKNVIIRPGVSPVASKGAKPFAHPRYWSAFILIGDPN